MSDTTKLTERQRFWLDHINACTVSKQSLKAYASQHGLNITSLYGASKKLKRQGLLAPTPSKHRFVRVKSSAPTRGVVSCRVLLVNGTVVELGCGVEDVEVVLATAARLK